MRVSGTRTNRRENIVLIPWQTGVTPSANKAFSYLESKRRGEAEGGSDEFGPQTHPWTNVPGKV